jgi:hypothetical protein
MPQFQLEVRSIRQRSSARRAVREELRDRGVSEQEIVNVELVVGELLGAAHDSEVRSDMTVMIETFPRLHSVRLCGIPNVHALTLAFGERRNADGTTDLWAEVPRSA